jgi:hypothetical protein
MEETQTIESSEIETSSEPIESTEEVAIQEPIATPKLREAKVDVDGHVLQINEKQLKALWGLPDNEDLSDKEFKSLVSAYKAQKTADQRSLQASKQEKLVKEIAELIQKNPFELLQRAGYDPRELAEQYLAQAIEEDMLPESEKELKRVRLERDELERQYREEMTRREQEQVDQALVQAQQEITSQIIDSLESSTLPKSADVVRRIANYMLIAEQRGLVIHPKQVIPLVEEDFKNLNSQILKSMDSTNRINYIGEDLLKQIRQEDLARLKKPTSNSVQSQPRSSRETTKKITKDEWRKQLSERIKS